MPGFCAGSWCCRWTSDTVLRGGGTDGAFLGGPGGFLDSLEGNGAAGEPQAWLSGCQWILARFPVRFDNFEGRS